MPLSPYLKIWSHPRDADRAFLFSTRTGSMTAMPVASLDRIRRGEVPAATAATLTWLGVWAEDLGTERAEVRGYLDEVNCLDPGVTVAVILGLGCNFACPYCYEGDKGTQAMDDATGDALVRFVRSRFRPGKETLTLDFYGGEPLLYRDRIRQLAGELRPWVEERGGRFRFSLVTNGSLLSPAVVDELVPLGLESVKVTVDGPADLHDRSRPYRSGKGSFATVLGNLCAVAGQVKVGLGGNFTAETWRRFPELLDVLPSWDLGPDRLSQVSFTPVMQTGASPETCAGCASVDEPWLAGACVALRGEILRRGYRTPKIAPTPCMVDLADAFTVHWDGSLTKCPALIGREAFAVGDLREGFTVDVATSFGGPRWKAEDRCRECEVLPLCFGGCRYMQHQREGTMAGVECQKGFLDATLEPMIRQDVAYRWGKPEVPGERKVKGILGQDLQD